MICSSHYRVILGLIVALLGGCRGQVARTPEQNLVQQIQESHIEGNVPPQDQFAALMQRDLDTYFTELYQKKATVSWELLREGATQSGVANPKYYLWVAVKSGENFLNEGAVRVAAIERSSFEVTDFLGIAVIKNRVGELYSVFPAEVCEKIKEKIRQP